MLMNDYLKVALVEWGCDVEAGLLNHGGDFDLLLNSLRELTNPYRLNDLRLTQDPEIIEALLKQSMECSALPLCDALFDLNVRWDEALFDVLLIEMERLQKIL